MYVGPSSQSALSPCLPGKCLLLPPDPAKASPSLATLLDPLPPQAELIADSFTSPLTLNVALLRTVLISAACA